MWRNPSIVRWWFLPLAVPVLFGVLIALAFAGAPLAVVIVVFVVAVLVVIGLQVFDAVQTPRRSAALLATLTPPDVAARVDLARLRAVAGSGHPKAYAAAAGLVQRGFPHLTKADALQVVRVSVQAAPPR